MRESQGGSVARVTILLFDGMAVHRVSRWASSGELPSFRRLKERGAFGTLRSTIPPVTAPAAAALLTGVGPEKSGIYDFYELGFGSVVRKNVNYLEKSAYPPVYRLSELFGIRVGLFGVPLLHPLPRRGVAFAVAGFGVPANRKYASPDEVFELVKKAGYTPHGVRVNPSDPQAVSALAEGLLRDWEIFARLWRRYHPELSICWLSETDHASHYFWKDESKMLRIYRAADSILEEAMDTLAGNDNLLIVVSDHGFSEIRGSFYPNALLWKLGYLKYRRSPAIPVKLLVTRIARYLRSRSPRLDAAAVQGITRRPGGLIRLIRKLILSYGDVDVSRTKVMAVGPPTEYALLYANPNLSTEEKNGILGELERRLRDIQGVTSVYTPAQTAARANHGAGAPDLIIQLSSGFVSMTSNLPHSKREFGGPPWRQFTGKHHRDGIIGMAGPGIAPGTELSREITDILPTALHFLGLPLPDYLDGTPISEAFERESSMHRDPQRISSGRIRALMVSLRAKSLIGGLASSSR